MAAAAALAERRAAMVAATKAAEAERRAAAAAAAVKALAERRERRLTAADLGPPIRPPFRLCVLHSSADTALSEDGTDDLTLPTRQRLVQMAAEDRFMLRCDEVATIGFKLALEAGDAAVALLDADGKLAGGGSVGLSTPSQWLGRLRSEWPSFWPGCGGELLQGRHELMFRARGLLFPIDWVCTIGSARRYGDEGRVRGLGTRLVEGLSCYIDAMYLRPAIGALLAERWRGFEGAVDEAAGGRARVAAGEAIWAAGVYSIVALQDAQPFWKALGFVGSEEYGPGSMFRRVVVEPYAEEALADGSEGGDERGEDEAPARCTAGSSGPSTPAPPPDADELEAVRLEQQPPIGPPVSEDLRKEQARLSLQPRVVPASPAAGVGAGSPRAGETTVTKHGVWRAAEDISCEPGSGVADVVTRDWNVGPGSAD